MIKEIALDQIRIDGGTQQRELIDEPTVQRYMNRIGQGDTFPEIDVVFDGSTYWLVDGFHRYHACRKLKRETIRAEISSGTLREAIWMSLAVNQTHGLPRKSEDAKKMLFGTVFPDDEWSLMTDKAMAGQIGCSAGYISKQRKLYLESLKTPTPEAPKEPDAPSEPPPPEIVLDQLGKEVPEHLAVIFLRRKELTDFNRDITTILKKIKDGYQKEDLLFCNCRVDQMKSHLSNFRSAIRFALPHAVCPYCGGDVNNQECELCDQHGFVNELTYQSVPEEMKG